MSAALAVPLVIGLAAVLSLFGKKAYFDAFLSGAREGLETAVRLLPTLVALLVAIRMLSASGAIDALAAMLAPAAEQIGLPTELLPLLLTRPFSGSASTAAYSSLLERFGPDSFPALCASVIMGSSDTLVYVCAVYFSSVSIKRTRHAIPCAITVALFCIFLGCAVCRLWFAASI